MKEINNLQDSINKRQGKRINDLEDRNKEILEIARTNRNKNTKYLNYIVKQARNTKADTVNSNAKKLLL